MLRFTASLNCSNEFFRLRSVLNSAILISRRLADCCKAAFDGRAVREPGPEIGLSESLVELGL